MARKEHRGRSSSPLVLNVLAAVCMIAWPATAQPPVYCIAHNTDSYVQGELSQRAKDVLAEGERYLRSRSVNVLRLLNASTIWQERGQMNFGIFEITAPAGGEPVALKIVDSNQFLSSNARSPAFREYIDVHSLLGELHVAPKLIAIIEGHSLKTAFRSRWESMKDIAEKFEFSTTWLYRNKPRGARAIGVVMQKLPPAPEQGPLHPINRARAGHPFMSHWTAEQLVTAARDMIEIRRRLITAGVQPIDQQFALTPSGRAYLMDLDQARFNAHEPSFDISYELLKVIVQWEEVSGQELPKDIRYGLLDEASLPYAVCQSDEDFKDLLHDWRCEDVLKGQ